MVAITVQKFLPWEIKQTNRHIDKIYRIGFLPLNPTLLGKACIQIKIKVDTLNVNISGIMWALHNVLFVRGCYFGSYSIIFCCGQYFLKPHWLPWKIYFLGPHFCWKRSPLGPYFITYFYKFRNPLHVGAVDDALDDIGLFQSVCGQFQLIKVVLL